MVVIMSTKNLTNSPPTKQQIEKDMKKYYATGTPMKQFKRIDEISSYNNNYYIGFDKDLLFAKSNDDNETIWFRMENYSFKLIGYSYTSEGEILEETNVIRSQQKVTPQTYSKTNEITMKEHVKCRFATCKYYVERSPTDISVGSYYCDNHKPSVIFNQ